MRWLLALLLVSTTAMAATPRNLLVSLRTPGNGWSSPMRVILPSKGPPSFVEGRVGRLAQQPCNGAYEYAICPGPKIVVEDVMVSSQRIGGLDAADTGHVHVQIKLMDDSGSLRVLPYVDLLDQTGYQIQMKEGSGALDIQLTLE